MEVQLKIWDNFLCITPWVPDLWSDMHYKRQEKQKKWPFKFVSTDCYMYTVEKDESGREIALTYSGMLDIVTKGLTARNIPWHLVDDRKPAPQPMLERCQPLRPLQDGALDVLCKAQMGVIECPPGFGKTFLLCQVARVFPDCKILVTTPRAPVVSDIMRRVSDALEEFPEQTVGLISGVKKFTKKMYDHQVVVVTSKSLHKIPTGWADIIIYDECHGCATEQQVAVLEQFSGCRRFGLSASPDGRLDGADMEVTGMFGSVGYRVTYQQAVDNGLVCPIQAKMVPLDYFNIDVNPKASDVKKQQMLYWRNAERNKAIAAAARTFSDDDSVLILVKTTEHALFLRLLLPDFYIVHGGIDDKKWDSFCKLGLVQDTPEFNTHLRNLDMDVMKKAFAECRVRKVIATPKWREGVDFPNLAGLIRADGSSGSIDAIQIVGRLSRIAEGKTHGVLYDFIDSYHPNCLRKSTDRRNHYEKQQWNVEKYSLPTGS